MAQRGRKARAAGAAAPAGAFDADCRRCPRLAAFLDQVAAGHPDYYCLPVAPFGDWQARLLVVGLAPGKHGANRTGRPFTGDYAGILLYDTLYRFGFSNRPVSESADDGLELIDCRISNAVKCLPPDNKPVGSEVANCNGYLQAELKALPAGSVILALGGVAHRAVIRALEFKQSAYPFGHGREHRPADGVLLLDSYHCSRYNTNTGRLTPAMFHAVFARARALIPQDRP